jgi:heme-degrading monooxygenase HmoA
MIAVIFEVEPREGRLETYLDIAEQLKPQLDQIDGFISVARFESIGQPGKYLSLSFWRDEKAIAEWRNLESHRRAQAAGRSGLFASYRLRIAQVVRDYGLEKRAEAPADSLALHIRFSGVSQSSSKGG